MKGKITFSWKEREDNGNNTHVGSMYCFKRCDINYN